MTYKHKSIYGTKPNDTSFEFKNMQTLLNIDLYLATQFFKCMHEYEKLFSNICMNESKIKGRKMNQMVY